MDPFSPSDPVEVPNVVRRFASNFDVTEDGRLLVTAPAGGSDPGDTALGNRIHVVLNWFEELKALVPTGR